MNGRPHDAAPQRTMFDLQIRSRRDCTIAYAARAQIERLACASAARDVVVPHAIEAAPNSTAEMAWESLGLDDVTAVYEATEAGWPHAAAEDTVQLHLRGVDDDSDDAPTRPESYAANDAPTQVGDTELTAETEAVLLLQLAADGYPGQGAPVAVHLIVRDGWVDVGCDCEGPWSDDAYLDAWHVRLLSAPGGVRVLDEGSQGGVWLRLEAARWLLAGDRFRLGAQFLRFEAAESCASPMRPGARGHVQLVVDDAPVGPALPVTGELVLGREAADAMFPHDPYVSAQHCRLVAVEDGVWIEDLASSNGTYVRVRSGESVPFGSVLVMGASVYRVESGEP